jgi:hypothetical protein
MEAAKAATFDAGDQVDRASRRRLNTYLLLPPQEQLDHLRNPILNKADRDRLARSIRSFLPVQARSNTRRPLTMKRLTTFLLRHVIAAGIIVIACGSVTIFVLQAYLHTGRLVSFPSAETLVFQMPGGMTQAITIPANTGISVVDRDDDSLVRIWVKKTGYALSPVRLSIPNGRTPTSN